MPRTELEAWCILRNRLPARLRIRSSDARRRPQVSRELPHRPEPLATQSAHTTITPRFVTLNRESDLLGIRSATERLRFEADSESTTCCRCRVISSCSKIKPRHT